MNKLIIYFIFVLGFQLSLAKNASAQQIRNLGFDKPSIVNPLLPFGWSNRWVAHQLSLDSLIAHSGKFSLESSQEGNDKKGYGRSTQRISSTIIRGKQLHVAVWIRTQNITEGQAAARIIVLDKNQNFLNYVSLPTDGIHDTKDWKKYSVDLDIKKTASFAYLQISHDGNGKAWFDDFKIFINGKKYNPNSFKPWQASEKELKWLKQHIVHFSTDDPNAELSRLNRLGSLLNDAKVIGLGENTHGTREFFRMKHRLIKWFASRNDTTVFAIEASMPEARVINNYVLYGRGNPKKALANLHFWTWDTQEVLDLIEWMRQYNKSGKGVIEFWGFDMQFPSVAADSVRSFIQRAEPAYLPELNRLYQPLGGPQALRGMPKKRLQTLHHAVTKVFAHFQENKEKYLRTFNSRQVAWVIQYARIIEQSVARFLPDGNTRDKSMAQNIEWISEHHAKDVKLIIWAHNAHINREPDTMGDYLNIYYGKTYRSVAFAFGKGTYSAVLGPQASVKIFTAPAPIAGSVEYVLHQLKVPQFAIDLRKAKNNPNGKWLMTPKLFRNIGSVARDVPYEQTTLAKYFDILIYFDNAEASHSL